MAMESLRKEITSSNNPEQARRLAWLGPPPLFEGEDAAAYDERLARIAEALKPEDIFVELWARDIAHLDWEVSSLRRLQASLMTAAAYEGLQKILEPLLVSVRKHFESFESFVIQSGDLIREGHHRCGRRRTADVTTAANCDIRVT